MNKLLVITFFIFSQVSLWSQSVEQLIEMAITYDPGIKAFALDHTAAKSIVNQTGFLPDPKFSMGLGLLPVETRLGAQRLKLGVSQAIPWKGSLDAEKALASAQADIFAHQGEVKAIDIAYGVREAYSVLIFINQQITLLDRRFEILEILESIAKTAVRSGKGKLSNVLLIQRNRELLEEERKMLQKQIDQPTIAINRWTGRELDTPIELVDSEITIDAKDQYQYFAETQHPQLKVLDSRAKALSQSSELSYYQQKPKLGVGLDYALIDDRNDVDIPRNGRDILMPMASISIPLNIDRFEAKRAENEHKKSAIVERAKALKDMYKAEIAQALYKLELSRLQKSKAERLKLITDETIKLMRTEYASEGTRFEELLRLEMELIDYDLMIIQADFQKMISKAVLLKYQEQ